jgi:Uma2 family endonuclease
MAIARTAGLLQADWETLRDPPGRRLELRNGDVVVNAAPRPVHQDVARYLANRLEEACPAGLKAVTDIEWRNLVADGAVIVNSQRPDVVVTRRAELRRAAAIVDPPVIAVEVISRSNTPKDVRDKRALYLANGLGCYVEVRIDDAEDTVSISWYLSRSNQWEPAGEATGGNELRVTEPFAFSVVPNDLLPW